MNMTAAVAIAVIADDLTGAADTGVQFCPAIGPVLLTDRPEELVGQLPAGLALSTDSRHADAAAAACAVTKAAELLARRTPGLIYKKIDSCLRGNLGAEIDALLGATGANVAFIAPAYPQQGRTTQDGIHRIDGVPIAATEIARDPRAPVRTSSVATLLSMQSQFKIGHIDLTLLEGSPDVLLHTVKERIDQENRLLVFDATKIAHLDRVAALIHKHFPAALPVGSAGLAASLASIMVHRQPVPQTGCRPIATWLFVCGSASHVLASQATRLAQFTCWPHRILEPADLTADHVTARLEPVPPLQNGGTAAPGLILSITAISANGPDIAPKMVILGLANLAAGLLSTLRPDAVFLSGGDTAQTFCRQVSATGLLLKQEILPGLVRGELANGPFKGLTVVTKAGGFGDDETLIRLVTLCTP